MKLAIVAIKRAYLFRPVKKLTIFIIKVFYVNTELLKVGTLSLQSNLIEFLAIISFKTYTTYSELSFLPAYEIIWPLYVYCSFKHN